MRIYGTYEGFLTFINAELFVGEKDGMENNYILLRPTELNGETAKKNAVITNNPDVFSQRN